MAKLTRKRPADRRLPMVPNTDKKDIEAAQVRHIEAAGQVLVDQGWKVLVAGGLKIMQWPEDRTGCYWLCMKFVGGKKGVTEGADDSPMRLLSKDDRDTARPRRTKGAAKSRVAKARKAK